MTTVTRPLPADRRVPTRRPISLAKFSSWTLAAAWAGLSAGQAFGQEQPPPAQPPAGQPAQPAQPTPPPAPPGGDEARQRFEQFRKTAEDRLKVLLGADEQEFEVLKPRIEKIQQMQMANDPRRVGMGMLMRGAADWRTRASNPGDGQRQANDGNSRPAGDRPPPPRWSPFGNVADTATSQRARELQEVLESKETASNETIKAKLAALRAAKQQAKQEMAQAQEELRQLCSVRQEAVLAIMGILD